MEATVCENLQKRQRHFCDGLGMYLVRRVADLIYRDFESKKHGYSANSYLEVLEDQLPKCWMPGLIFVHDNAPIHTANAVKKWFEEMDIPFTDWPPYSPDLNPIENAWALLKKKVLEMHPELEHVTGKSEEDIQ